MNNKSKIQKIIQLLSKNQQSIIRSLFESNVLLPIESFHPTTAILSLRDRDLIEIEGEYISLSILGKDIAEYWRDRENSDIPVQDSSTEFDNSTQKFRQKRLEKSNHFLELYKQGLSYQDIGDKYGISRERVRQVLNPNVAFRQYLREREEAKITAEDQKKEQINQKLYSRSLAALYPERVVELWDYEKNGDLKPEGILAGSTQYYIWFKCSEGHSWDQKPNQIVASWRRSGTSGCPMCAGKKKKAKKQPFLINTGTMKKIVILNYIQKQ
jgi:Probable Zinc-ribbon domain/Sigma-70, region 4